VVESAGAYSLQRSGAKALPVLVPDVHLGCPSSKSNLLENDQLLRRASLPARPSDKVVTRIGIATIKVFQPAHATTPVLTLSPVDPVP
jgi:hypothetical protein